MERLKNSLNSNLILLILIRVIKKPFLQPTLNSNLILLIREAELIQEPKSIIFKFQSDSINTGTRAILLPSKKSLNSNLILLILNAVSEFPFAQLVFKFQSDSINTLFKYYNYDTHKRFKFQSDSINTTCRLQPGNC